MNQNLLTAPHDLKRSRLAAVFDYLLYGSLLAFLFLSPWFYGLTRFRDQLAAEIAIFSLFLLTLPFVDLGSIKSKLGQIDGLVFGGALVSFFYVVGSALPYQSFLAFLTFSSALIFYALVRKIVSSTQRLKVFLWTIFLSGVFYAGYGLFQYYGFIPHPYWYQPNSLASRYINGGHFAAFLLFPLGIGASLFISSRKEIVRLTILPLLFVLLWALLLTRSRGVWLAFFIGFVCWMGFVSRAKPLKKSALFGLLLCGIVGGLILVKTGVAADVSLRIQELWKAKFYSLHYRLDLWQGCLRAIAERPWGWGLGTLGEIFGPFRVQSDRFLIAYAHNEFFQIGVELGIPGILFVLYFLFSYYRKAFSLLKAEERDSFLRTVGASFAVLVGTLVLASQADFPLRIYANGLYFIAVLALSRAVFEPEAVLKTAVRGKLPKALLFVLVFLCGAAAAKQLLAEAHFEKGKRYERELGWGKAEAEFRRASALAPYFDPYPRALGDLFRRKNENASDPEFKRNLRREAIHWYEQALRLNRYETKTYHHLALLYEEEGEVQKAKSSFEKALIFEPLNELLLVEYGYFATRHSLVEEAIISFEKFKRIRTHLEGQRATPCEIVNQCYRVTQDYDQLKRVIPDSWQGHHCLGQLLAEHDRWDLAKIEFDLALAWVEPRVDYDYYLEHMGRPVAGFYIEHNRLREALEIYEKAIARNPGDDASRRKVEELSQKLGLVR